MSGLIDTGIAVSLPEANTTFNMAFQRGLQTEQEAVSAMFTQRLSSGGASSKYPAIGQMTGLREWVGPRVYDDFARLAYELPNRKFEKSLEVPVDALEDDQLDGYALLAEQLGNQCDLWPDDLALEALQAGTTRLCVDGQFFFDTDHPTDPGNSASPTYANLFTATALSSTNFAAKLAAMQTIVGRDKRPMGFARKAGSLILLVPPGLREVGKQIVEAEYLANGASNVNSGAAKLVVWDRLYDATVAATATTWYLLDVSKLLKPIIFQERLAPAMRPPKDDDESVADQDVYRWRVKARGAAGYGMPFTACRCDA
jgi:phage major head subunit gpT-like protein